MSDQDQASGLRKWANLQRQQQQAESQVPSKAKIPLIVVGLPSGGAPQVSRVKARLGQWSTLGRSWAGDPNDWDIHIAMAETSDLAQLCDQYSRWALWISSDADAFAAMYRTLRQLHERGGPRRLLALHEPDLPRQGLLDNLRGAAEYYLNMELLVLAR